MKKTVFAERQYETTFLGELGQAGAGAFQPTQRLERFLGIDAATDAQNAHRIWRILNVNVPQRMPLSPAVWPRLPHQYHRDFSSRIVSLFFQFKVARFQDGGRAKYRSAFGAPYFEVSITKHQQMALENLQQSVRARAIVRYASPAFWSQTDFDKYAASRRVLTQSAFLRPSQVGTHKKWMYAGPLGKCILNPDPEETDSESWERLKGRLTEQAQEESIKDHVRQLAESLREREEDAESADNAPWLDAIREYWRLSEENARYLSDLRTVVNAAERADTTWLIMFTPDEHTGQLLNAPRDMFEYYVWYWI